MAEPVEALEARLGYGFRDRSLLTRALTHRSRSFEIAPDLRVDNEQLEFLGDSVLGFLVSEALVARRPSAREGELSQLKSHLVSATHLYSCARELSLGDDLLMGKGEEQTGGRKRKTVLSDAMEAVIAAIYLDGGIEHAKRFVHEHILSHGAADLDLLSSDLNHKSGLQERMHALGLPAPEYTLHATSGPSHAMVFTVEVRVGDRYSARGTGTSKKTASQEAARLLLEQLDAEATSGALRAGGSLR